MRKLLVFLVCCTLCAEMLAQSPCDSVQERFGRWETRIGQLTNDDPELVALHYLFLQDILKAMQQFQERELPTMTRCATMDYYQIRAAYQRVRYMAEQKNLILKEHRDHVEDIFYQKAVEELRYQAVGQCHYYLDRALQYAPFHADALLLKARLQLDEGRFEEAVKTIHIIYTKSTLTDLQEQQVSDFTLELYERMYNRGQELIQQGLAAEALETFQTLEHFCNNMPSGYCNDDYYRGILVSREGVYESYISIAKAAEQRHNYEMAKKFYGYAEEYKKQLEP